MELGLKQEDTNAKTKYNQKQSSNQTEEKTDTKLITYININIP